MPFLEEMASLSSFEAAQGPSMRVAYDIKKHSESQIFRGAYDRSVSHEAPGNAVHFIAHTGTITEHVLSGGGSVFRR